jgi:hypothetical protein
LGSVTTAAVAAPATAAPTMKPRREGFWLSDMCKSPEALMKYLSYCSRAISPRQSLACKKGDVGLRENANRQ